MLLNFFCIFAYAKMLFNGTKPQTPLSSRNQSINMRDMLHTQHCIMGLHPNPHIFYELQKGNYMERINQQLQKIVTLTPYHLGELITTVETVEKELRTINSERVQNRQDTIKYLKRIKEQANIIRKAKEMYGTNDLVAVLRLEIAQNQLQKLLNEPNS